MNSLRNPTAFMFGENELPTIELGSPRLRLRQWQASDLAEFARLNSDPEVMAHMPGLLSTCDSNTLAERCKQDIAKRGWGAWAVELKTTSEFIGFVGLNVPSPDLPCSPCVEVAWRLARKFWRQGYATEAAQAALDFGFSALGMPEIVAFTSIENYRSRAVMIRLGMRNTERNFLHPNIAPDNPLAEHVLFSITRNQWQEHSASE